MKHILRQKLSTCHPDKPAQARGLCKNCYDKWLKKNNPKFLENQRANHKKWMEENKEKSNKYKYKWLAKQDPDYRRVIHLKKYGLTLTSYANLLDSQKGVCAICENPPKKGKNLHVDHDHNTGKVRGLLCFRCNFGLSFFQEDKRVISKLYEYFN